MKKTPRNLVLRSETLRTLTNIDLVRAVGGLDSGDNQCLNAYETGAKQCPGAAAIDLSVGCR